MRLARGGMILGPFGSAGRPAGLPIPRTQGGGYDTPEPVADSSSTVEATGVSGQIRFTFSTAPETYGAPILDMAWTDDSGDDPATANSLGVNSSDTFPLVRDVLGLTDDVEITNVYTAVLTAGGWSAWSEDIGPVTPSAGYTENGVIFDGVNDYMNKTGGSPYTDGSILLFLSFEFTGSVGSGHQRVISNPQFTCEVRREAVTGELRVIIEDTTGASVIDVTTSYEVTAERVNVLICRQASGREQCYVWTSPGWAEEHNTTANANATDMTVNNWGFGAEYTGAAKAPAIIYRFALWTGISVPDLSDPTVRDKFCNSLTGALVDPAMSVSAYGTPETDYYGAASVWNAGTNQGSGADWVMNGSVVDV